MRWDLGTKAFTTAYTISSKLTDASTAFGATWGTPSDYIYGEDNTSGRIWRFYLPNGATAPVTTVPQFVSLGSVDDYSDGARCVNFPA